MHLHATGQIIQNKTWLFICFHSVVLSVSLRTVTFLVFFSGADGNENVFGESYASERCYSIRITELHQRSQVYIIKSLTLATDVTRLCLFSLAYSKVTNTLIYICPWL